LSFFTCFTERLWYRRPCGARWWRKQTGISPGWVNKGVSVWPYPLFVRRNCSREAGREKGMAREAKLVIY